MLHDGCVIRKPALRRCAQTLPAIRAEIDHARARSHEAAVTKGAPDAMAALLADGVVMVRRPVGRTGTLCAASRAVKKGPIVPFHPVAKITTTPIEVVALSKEWAWRIRDFGYGRYTPDGADKAQQLRDTYLILFRNTGDGWKAYREVASSAGPRPVAGQPIEWRRSRRCRRSPRFRRTVGRKLDAQATLRALLPVPLRQEDRVH